MFNTLLLKVRMILTFSLVVSFCYFFLLLVIIFVSVFFQTVKVKTFIAFPLKFCLLNISVLTFLQFFLDWNTRLKERLKSWKQTNPHISLWQREKGDTICLCFALSYSFFLLIVGTKIYSELIYYLRSQNFFCWGGPTFFFCRGSHFFFFFFFFV